MNPVDGTGSTGICVVTIYSHRRYNVYRVMATVLEVQENDTHVGVSAHVDVDDALAVIGSFLRGFGQGHRSAE